MQRKQRTTKHTPNYEHRPEETARRSPTSPSPSPTSPSPEEQNLPMRKESERHRSASKQLDTWNRPARARVLELQLNEPQAAKARPQDVG